MTGVPVSAEGPSRPAPAELLRAAIEETERTASAVASGSWSAYLEGGDDGWAVESSDGALSFTVGDQAMAWHAALNDPRAVLRRCAVDRKLLALHAPCDYNMGCAVCDGEDYVSGRATYPCETVKLLAEGYGLDIPVEGETGG